MIIWILFACTYIVHGEISEWTLAITDNSASATCTDVTDTWNVPTSTHNGGKIYNNELDGNTCIPVAITGPTDAVTNWMRLWCVAEDLLYMRMYHSEDSDNCLHSSAKEQLPYDSTISSVGATLSPVSAATLQYEGFLPKATCQDVANSDGTGGATDKIAETSDCQHGTVKLKADNFSCDDLVLNWPDVALTLTCFGNPSARPTSRPTARPSTRPSTTPSSQLPSGNPSKSPTLFSPTNMPTNHPSPPPTMRPSAKPSAHPSLKPSNHPSGKPSPPPTPPPTVNPSLKPSNQPSPPPTPPPTNPTMGPSTIRPTLMPTPSPSCMPTVTNSPSPPPTPAPTEPTMDPSPPPTPQPVSDSPTTTAPKMPSPDPTTSGPTPNPTPPPVSASPHPPPTPEPTPPPLEPSIRNKLFEWYGAEATILASPAASIRSLCFEGGWDRIQTRMQCFEDNKERTARWEEQMALPETTPALEFPTTTKTPQGELNTSTDEPTTNTMEENFDHPHSTEKPDMAPEIWHAVQIMYGKGKEEYHLLCGEVKNLAQPATKQLVEDFFANLDLKLPLCQPHPKLDLWEAFENVSMDKETNMHLQTLLISPEGKVENGLTAVCKSPDEQAFQNWIQEWENMDKDQQFIDDFLRPETGGKHSHDGKPAHEHRRRHLEETAHENDVEVLTALHALTSKEIKAACAVAENYDMTQVKNFWKKSMDANFPYDDVQFWIGRVARMENLNRKEVRALLLAPMYMFESYAHGKESAKLACEDVLNHVTQQVGDIWSNDYLKNFREQNRRSKYLMQQCLDLTLDLTKMEAETQDSLGTAKAHCEDVMSRFSDTTTVGKGGDIEYEELQMALLYCQSDVENWLGTKYNHEQDNIDTELYCRENIMQNLDAGETVPLLDFAYWEFSQLDRFFNCLEKTVEPAKALYLDSSLRTCSVLKGLDTSKYEKMSRIIADAGEETEFLVDFEMLNEMMKEEYSKKIVDAMNKWVAVERDEDMLFTRDIPALTINFGPIEDVNQDALSADLQLQLDIAVADEWVVNGETVEARWYGVTESDVTTKVEQLSELWSGGLKHSSEGLIVQVLGVAIVSHFEEARAEFEKYHGAPADKPPFRCAINPDAEEGLKLHTPEGVIDTRMTTTEAATESAAESTSAASTTSGEGGTDVEATDAPDTGAVPTSLPEKPAETSAAGRILTGALALLAALIY